MTDKIVRLANASLPEGHVSDEVVSRLQELLERAQAGEIFSLCYACVAPHNRIIWGLAGDASWNDTIASLELLRAKLVADWVKEGGE